METNENELDEKNYEKIQGEEDIFVHTRPNSVNKFERKQSQIPTENEINAALVQMISKGVFPPEYMHPYIFTSLNRRRVDAICKSDYDEAEKMDKISEMLTQSIKDSQINNDNQIKGEILYERFCKINENVQEINEKYDKKKEAILNESEKRKQEATEKYNNTEKEIYEKFQNPEFLQKYGKPSNRLSELREQEREYAMQRKYKEAREVKTEADEIERQETEVAQEKVSKQETLELEMNYKNYQKELQLIELRQNQQISLNESDRERELRPLEAALKQIRSKKPILPPLRPQSNLSEQSANSPAHIKPSSKMQSPRTQMKLRQMRTEKRVTLLAVKPQPTTKRDQQRLSRLQGTQARSSKVTSRNKNLKLPPMKGGRTQRATTRSQQAKAEKKNKQKEQQEIEEQQNEQVNVDQQKHEEQVNEDQQQQEQENAKHQQNNEQAQLYDESSTGQVNVEYSNLNQEESSNIQENGEVNHEENNVSSEQQPQQDEQQNEGETSVDNQSTNENINSNESLNKENVNSTEQTNEENLNQENQNNEHEQIEQQKEIINNEQQETSGEQNN